MTLAHLPILETRSSSWPDEAACAACAAQLARHPELHNAFITLHGELGAGKTTFVRHLLHALGVAGRVKSPTYAVLESYECPQGRAAPSPPPAGVKQSGEATFACELPGLLISHFDFYRFNDAREWHDAGFRDVFAAPGLKLAEWPEKAAAVLPPPDLALHLHARDERWRDVTLQAHSECGLALLRA